MKALNNLLQGINSYMTFRGRVKTREILLSYSDRMLEDAGFSRELLESGVSAWPWHAPTATLPPLNLSQEQNAAAIRELQSYSDSELHDLGISRGSIKQSVKFGRDGIENNTERKVA